MTIRNLMVLPLDTITKVKIREAENQLAQSELSMVLGSTPIRFDRFPARVGRKLSEVGGSATPGNRFVSFVRAYTRSGSEVGIGENGCRTPFPFPFGRERWI